MKATRESLLHAAQTVSDAWQGRIDEHSQRSESYTHRYWVFTPQGDFVREIVKSDLDFDEQIEMADEREKGNIVGKPYPGCIGAVANRTQAEDFAGMYMNEMYWLMTSGVLAGTVLGPIHGVQELDDLRDHLMFERLGGDQSNDLVHLAPGDPRIARASSPWLLLAQLDS